MIYARLYAQVNFRVCLLIVMFQVRNTSVEPINDLESVADFGHRNEALKGSQGEKLASNMSTE